MKSDNSELCLFIGERIREFRKALNMSQEVLAEKSGLHRTYIGCCERGERNITIINLHKICKSLNIELADFFSELR